ncbi:MAG: hypothetical protein LBT10_05915 [Methanobrevibacter sp.]|nr:hypothetical protein [Methanobrevibacter sp.]
MAIVEIKIEDKLFKIISEIAKEENRTENHIITNLIEKSLKTSNNQIKKTVDDLMVNKDRYNPNASKKELNSIIGIFKAPKGFNSVEALNEIHREY